MPHNALSAFEQAADAIVRGQDTRLQELIRNDPQIVLARSHREHRATLLHYTAANGVEDERQRTPRNIVEITGILLEAGAEVDAVADCYGGSTTLSLAASSVHPERAGVQIDLMQVLLDNGAAIDGVPGTATPILAALHNGRGDAAVFLAQSGASLDIESAAGTGRVDLVREIDGRGNADPEKRAAGLAWASHYGHILVMEYLLDTGGNLDELIHGHTPLHWAATSARTDVVRLLLERGASRNVPNRYGATALGQAQWSAEHDGDPRRFQDVIGLLT